MHHETETVSRPAAAGGDLFLRRWSPDPLQHTGTGERLRGSARGVVALVHGVHEHSGRYAWLAGQLMLRGLEVWAVDLRGHGQSAGLRGAVGAFDDFVDDLEVLLDRARAAADGRPLFLMGHSMGGLVVCRGVTAGRVGEIDGLVLSSPALAVAAPRLLQKAAPLVARWAPRFPAGKLDLSQLAHDPAVARAYREDPLNTVRPVAAALGWEIMQAIRAVRADASAFTMPLYLFHGTADEIVPVEASEWLYAAAPSADKTFRRLEGLRHETFREAERETILADLGDWLVQRLDA